MIQQLIGILHSELELTAEEIADLLWLTLERQKRIQSIASQLNQSQKPEVNKNAEIAISETIEKLPSQEESPSSKKALKEEASSSPIYSATQTTTSSDSQKGYVPISVPDARSLREPLDFIRSLKPLLRQVPSQTEQIINEQATVDWIAQTDLWMPILQPSLESWLELALVIDESKSMILWRHLINELQQVLTHYGMFRDVRVWGINKDHANQISLRSQTRFHSTKELIDPQNRRLIMVVSDGVDDIWRDAQIITILDEWTANNPVVMIQMLPRWMWSRTALGLGTSAQFSILGSSIVNSSLTVGVKRLAKRRNLDKGINLPVITLEPKRAKDWSRMLAGQGEQAIAGYVLRADLLAKSSTALSSETITAQERVSNFNVNASPLAKDLAGLLAAAPMITMPVVRLIQDSMLTESNQIHVAEVFLGGLLKPSAEITFKSDPEQVQYDFINGVRSELLKSIPVPDSEKVFDRVSRHLAKKFGKTLRDFVAWLQEPSQIEDQEQAATVKPFAKVAKEILQQLGYQLSSNEAEVSGGQGSNGKPAKLEFKTRTFEIATIEVQETRSFEFSVATLEPESQPQLLRLLRVSKELVIKRQKQQGTAIIELLEPDVDLELLEIPGGSFIMGSPEEELESFDRERPQHQVTVSSFLMGRYPITQGQWRIVAGWPEVERELDPDPSRFKENYKGIDRWTRPVEQVSWEDAKEFCARLSKKTKKEYRLPTEAEWEYACRAVISDPNSKTNQSSVNRKELTVEQWNQQYNQPFHFGETISTKLANYDGDFTYGEGVKGESRGQTTPVGYFSVANAFGLSDMHGNVFEWCEDDWHENYEKAPTDGRAWFSGESSSKVIRGGSWGAFPSFCRSAFRYYNTRGSRDDGIGFRVVCVAPRAT